MARRNAVNASMRKTTRKRVAVIGAGCSGLTCIKSCLDENLEPVCFEREPDIGGLWNYSEEMKHGRGSVYKSCVINTSKEMMSFSDFPVPAHFPSFMSHSQVLEYFRLYAKEFNLLRHIRFNTSVENIYKADDYEFTGRWKVIFREVGNGVDEDGPCSTLLVDSVMVCTGHHVYPNLPDFPGLTSFSGPSIHSHEYRRPEEFEDKNVLIIGIGNSAVDIAVDISRVAKKTFISTRKGAWIISRVGPFGLPADALANSRAVFSMPPSWLQWFVEAMANFRFDHDAYGVRPSHRALEAHPTINDELPYRITTGAVQIRPHVSQFGKDDVTFDDGSSERIDAVIMATGYNYKFKFFDDNIIDITENRASLYKFVYPPNLQHPTLAVIGLVQAIGAVMPISEIQARWHTRVFKGLCKLPQKEEMEKDIAKKMDAIDQQYIPSKRHTLETFWIAYMDEIANMFGARPNLLELFPKNPTLATWCFLAPCVPAQYRLQGPGRWEGAADVIQAVFKNHITGMKRRTVALKTKETKALTYSVVDILTAILIMWLFFVLLRMWP